MRSQHLEISLQEFRRLPRKPGWKYGYFEGRAHITPRSSIVAVTLGVSPRPICGPHRIVPLPPGSGSALVRAFVEAFLDTIEYCDWPADRVLESAENCVRGFLEGRRGAPLDASRVAMHEGEMTGAALIVDREGEPLLDILLVRPAWRRRGLATALVSAAINELHLQGQKSLRSRFNPGNLESAAWHREFGFAEEPKECGSPR